MVMIRICWESITGAMGRGAYREISWEYADDVIHRLNARKKESSIVRYWLEAKSKPQYKAVISEGRKKPQWLKHT